MRTCPNCNHQAGDQFSFCPMCGSALEQLQPEANIPQPVVEPIDTEATQSVFNAPIEPVVEETVVAEPIDTEATQGVYTAPVQNQYTYSAPVQNTYSAPAPQYKYAEAPVKKPNLAKKIVGMALSIEGFVMAIFLALYSLIFLAVDPAFGFGYAFGFSIFSVPGSIIGLIFSNAAQNEGDTSALSRVGKGLGLAGLIIAIVCLVISFFVLVADYA